MKYAIIGSGNLAYFLLDRLSKITDNQCLGIYSRNTVELATLCNKYKTDLLDFPQLINLNPEIIFLAVNDQSIEEIALALSSISSLLIYHSGSISFEPFKMNKNFAVLWPIYSIQKNNLPTAYNVPIAFEGNNSISNLTVQKIASTLSNNVFQTNEEQRNWLHLMAVLSNNFINHLIALNQKIATEHQIPFSLIEPIIHQTFNSLNGKNAIETQTGPAIRNDIITLKKHQKLLIKHPNILKIYNAISESIQKIK